MTKISPPIIYLDQCHWITLAQAQFAPHKIPSPDEFVAANFILKAARTGQILLPLSGAHVIETMKAGNGTRRHQLAETMLSAYSGWHMNNPVAVRGGEMVQALLRQTASLDREQVFNQRPGTPFGIAMPYTCSDQTLPPQFQRLSEALSWHLAWADILRSETYNGSEWAKAYEGIRIWVQVLQGLSSRLKERPLPPQKLRILIGMQTLDDLKQELAASVVQIGMDSKGLEKQLCSDNIIEFFQQLPFVGRVMEIINIRLRNPQDTWTENDFIDLLFLSCAAAYADFVVAERKATHMLRQVGRQTSSGATVFASLRELHRYLVSDALGGQSTKAGEPGREKE